ncbi:MULTISPECIES: HAD family hydrolase [Oceanotoga]|uniref:HAD superfamily hydrolase (TIGR01490 family) n=1 Tax=Oceanotoga teriensis TaxID=515440 RepID=A0AA45C527_9BACT|nr:MULTISPECIES: HAD-IB family hydrolase [Oceanotoga]MDN5342797.1 hypothetical protein [Oceanotoga sp.]MDO7977676.1 HAD-IB family hydrolase [Oceanotoga teriensis]PWJ87545.1 HAD superfamily hydrolase (TIGR01490 family) [Oceanotoga teriensis]
MFKYTVFFDMDKTLLTKNSGPLYFKYLLKTGQIKFKEYTKLLYMPIFYYLGIYELEDITSKLSNDFVGESKKKVYDRTDKWFKEYGINFIRKSMILEVEKHRERGAKLILLSASPENVCHPVFEYFNLHEKICTRLIYEEDRFIGVEETSCYGEEKVRRVKEYMDKNHVDLEKAFFYSDSISDLPFLKIVGNPICVSPDKKLKKYSEKNSWDIIEI